MKRGRPGRPARRLRVSIEALPPATKRAMLEGVRSGPINAGAYTSPEGTCPASRHRSASVPGDADRSRELRERPGWAGLRVFRRLDDYEVAVALAQVRAEGADVVERRGSLVGAPADR